MLLANTPTSRKSRKGGVRVSLVHADAKPFSLSAPVTGQQREQSSHRTPKTLITALHSLPTVFYPNLLPNAPLIFSDILPPEPGCPPIPTPPLRPRPCATRSSLAHHYMQMPRLSPSANKSRGRAI